MKISVPVEEGALTAPVCQSFGRTPLFLMFDTETEKHEILDNSAAASQGGAGIQAAQMLADSGAEVLITYRCGENAVEVLKAANIKTYKAQDGSVAENISSYKAGVLKRLSVIHYDLNNG